jgi:hypothetical protein
MSPPARNTTQETKPEIVETPVTLSSVSRARQMAEREFLSVLLFDPTEASAALRESTDSPSPDEFLDSVSASIAEYIMPKLQAGTLFSMSDVMRDLDDECANVATTLYFVGQRICETYESVLYALQMTTNALRNAIEKQEIDDAVKAVETSTDSDKKTQAAQEAIESIRRQQSTRNAP